MGGDRAWVVVESTLAGSVKRASEAYDIEDGNYKCRCGEKEVDLKSHVARRYPLLESR